MLVTYDEDANSVYLYVRPFKRGSAVRQETVSSDKDKVSVVVDYNANGEILGVNLIGGSGAMSLLPRVDVFPRKGDYPIMTGEKK